MLRCEDNSVSISFIQTLDFGEVKSFIYNGTVSSIKGV